MARPTALADVEAVPAEHLRAVFGTVCTPVAVVTTGTADAPHGTTVSSFSSLSLDPPLVLVALDERSDCLEAIHRHEGFALNVLGSDQEDLAVDFARKGTDKGGTAPWQEHLGLPRLARAQAVITCRTERFVVAGDHEIVIGLVVGVEFEHDRAPLLYRGRRFRQLDGEPLAGTGA